MYKCKLHGKQETNWCDKCDEFLQCDCSDITTSRVKDVHYGEHDYTVTIYIEHCETCGEIQSVSF